jgi:hypothetical protein
VENIYENILKSIHETAEEVLDNQEKKRIASYGRPIDEEKKALYLKWLNSKSEEDKQSYIRKKKRRLENRKCRKNKI